MKMLGSITGAALKALIQGIEAQMENDHRPHDLQVAIPRDVLVALYHEYQESLYRHFYYELGRTIRLEESRNAVREKIPTAYVAHFDLGAKDRDTIEGAEEKCLHCNKLGLHRLVPRGRLAKRIKEHHENSDRQQKLPV